MDVSPKLKIYYWDYFFLIAGSTGKVPEHSHNAIQLFIDRAGNQRIKVGNETLHKPFVVVNKNVPHTVQQSGKDQISLLIDGDSAAAAHFAHRYLKGMDYTSDQSLIDSFYLNSPRAFKTQLYGFLNGKGCPVCAPKDPRITKVKQLIDEDEEKKLPLIWLCDQVGLSESRLAHLFKEETGIPVRKYLLWKRLISALEIILRGRDLTSAAHLAGFSDSAHLSRTFKSNFGFNLSKIFKNSRFIQFHSL